MTAAPADLAAVAVTCSCGVRVMAARSSIRLDRRPVYEWRGEKGVQFWSVSLAGDWPQPVEVTATVAELLTRRLAASLAASRDRQRREHERLREAAETTTIGHQRKFREIEEEVADRAGAFRHRARTPLQILHAGRHLTGRQFSAGQALAEDHLLAQMVRQPPEPDMPQVLNPDGGCWQQAALDAMGRVEQARRACERTRDGAWTMVRAVVLEERTVSDVAGSGLARHRRPFMTALRIGLDAVGDCYRLPSGVLTTQVFLAGITVPLEFTEDSDGRSVVQRSVTLNGRPWVVEARSIGEVYRLAKDELRRRVVEVLGEGDHAAVDIGRALEFDRRATVAREVVRGTRQAERSERRLAEIEAERRRVLRL